MKHIVSFSDLADMISDPAVIIRGETIVYINPSAKSTFTSFRVGDSICHLLSLPLMSIETIGDAAYPFAYNGSSFSIYTAIFNSETIIIFKKNINAKYSDVFLHPQTALSITSQLRDFLSLSFISFANLGRMMDEQEKQKFGEPLSIMRRSLYQKLNLVNHLDLLAHAFSNKLKLNCAPIDIASRLTTITDCIRTLLDGSGISVKFKSNVGTGFIVIADMPKLETALLCAVSNAIKYSPSNGNVDITLSSDMNNVFLHIEDNGQGISDTSGVNIRRKFSVPSVLSNPKAGAGFGISVIDEIAALHSGSLDIKSVPGSGTVITIVIPHASFITSSGHTDHVKPITQDPSKTILVELSDVLQSSKYKL